MHTMLDRSVLPRCTSYQVCQIQLALTSRYHRHLRLPPYLSRILAFALETQRTILPTRFVYNTPALEGCSRL